MEFAIDVAGHVIGVRTGSGYVHGLCARYMTDRPVERTFEVTPEDIASERAEVERMNATVTDPRQRASLGPGSLEWMALHRQVSDYLLGFDTMLFHGSCVAVDGLCYLFMAPSGTGKSTHTALWMELFGERAMMVNGDKPFVHVARDGITAYGSPWDGKEHLSTNVGLPLHAIAIVHRGQENHIEPIVRDARMHELARGAYVPDGAASRLKAAILMDEILAQVSIYSLTCNMEPEAAGCSYGMMSGGVR